MQTALHHSCGSQLAPALLDCRTLSRSQYVPAEALRSPTTTGHALCPHVRSGEPAVVDSAAHLWSISTCTLSESPSPCKLGLLPHFSDILQKVAEKH